MYFKATWNSTRFDLPLVETKIDCHICDDVGIVVLHQKYVNNTDKACTVTFTIPSFDGLVLQNLEVQLDQRIVKCELTERKRLYSDACRDSLSSHSMKVGDVDPKATVVLSARFHTTLILHATGYKFILPHSLTPVAFDNGGIQSLYPIQSSVNSPSSLYKRTVDGDVIGPAFSAKSEKKSKQDGSLSFGKVNAAPLTINFSIVSTDCLVKDFIIAENPLQQIHKKVRKNSGELLLKGKSLTYDLIVDIQLDGRNQETIAWAERKGDAALVKITFEKLFRETTKNIEFLFLLDCSSSMRYGLIEKARRTLSKALHALPSDSLYNVIVFGDTYNCLHDFTIKASADNIAKTETYLKDVGATMGGTDLQKVFSYVNQLPLHESYHRKVIMITDVVDLYDEDVQFTYPTFILNLQYHEASSSLERLAIESNGKYKVLHPSDNYSQALQDLIKSSTNGDMYVTACGQQKILKGNQDCLYFNDENFFYIPDDDESSKEIPNDFLEISITSVKEADEVLEQFVPLRWLNKTEKHPDVLSLQRDLRNHAAPTPTTYTYRIYEDDGERFLTLQPVPHKNTSKIHQVHHEAYFGNWTSQLTENKSIFTE